MASGEPKIDGDLVRALAALLDETGLSEIEYAVGDVRIRVARGVAPVAAAIVAPPPAAAPPAREAEAHPPEGAVTSPMVGTAYLAPQPGAAPFVAAGDSVREGQVLLLVEAMKVMNQIHAPRAGRVARIVVTDGAPVEYGQVLMLLE
ncbi:MAG TPA: acetyl-CoA carboxylase biotin carboxyl carrier protein subunit [Stellaceae bacterium]|nr:acetyl-CoA carboxylase biotin carboxyl carrier protein subunit [Stellaceae bacterium]